MNQAGRQREGMALVKAAVELARAGGHVAAEIRALANVAANIDDPLESSEVNRQAFDLAMRVGNVNLARWSRESIRFASFLLAEGWEDALSEAWADVDASLGGGGSLSDEARWTETMISMRLHRGEPVDDLMARSEAIAAEISDPSVAADVLSDRGALALVAGDYAEAARLDLAAADLGSQITHIYLSFAIRASILAGDVEGARAALERHRKESPGNHIDVALGIAAAAGIAALEGRLDEAIEGYREAIARISAMHLDWVVALLGFEFVYVIGADHPATREAAARSRAIFERVGARPWLAKLDAALAAAPAPRASTRAANADPRTVEAPRV